MKNAIAHTPGRRGNAGCHRLAVAGLAGILAAVTSGGCALISSLTRSNEAISEPVPGLFVEDVVVGTGALVEPNSLIVARMTGRLPNGRIFQRMAEPVGPWPLDDLIPGLALGLEGMAVGGTRRVTIPSDLAYGDTNVFAEGTATLLVPRGVTIVYDVELIDVMRLMTPDVGAPATPPAVQP
ncbi:MAG: FKBP-type peptidyl-prolyl cis-trans isomerase [Planctomycetota bacterium]|jgi:hypothetical protein